MAIKRQISQKSSTDNMTIKRCPKKPGRKVSFGPVVYASHPDDKLSTYPFYLLFATLMAMAASNIPMFNVIGVALISVPTLVFSLFY